MQGIKVSPGGLGGAVSDILRQYSDDIVKEMPEAVKQAAKTAVKQLKGSAPSRTGKYKGSFKTKTTESTSSLTTVEVYSSKPGLPHLLEFGHVIRNRTGKVYGVTRAFPHWAPAEEAASEELEKLIREKAEAAG